MSRTNLRDSPSTVLSAGPEQRYFNSHVLGVNVYYTNNQVLPHCVVLVYLQMWKLVLLTYECIVIVTSIFSNDVLQSY